MGISWTEKWKKMSAKSRWFYFHYYIYMILMLLTALYAYLRIEFVKVSNEHREKQFKHESKQAYPRDQKT